MVNHKGRGGFTLVETLLVLSVSIVLSTIFLNMFKVDNKYVESLESKQIKSINDMQKILINEERWFNRNGNVNLSGRFEYGSKRCVIYLGYGRFNCE